MILNPLVPMLQYPFDAFSYRQPVWLSRLRFDLQYRQYVVEAVA